jgi:hypothetical protein
MTKIYAPPSEIGNPPEITHPFNSTAYETACLEFIRKVQSYAKTCSTDKNAGEIIRFPVADGYAEYVVLSLKPVKLIHLPLADAYHFQYANRLTAIDVREEIKKSKAIAKLFRRT